MYLLVYRRTYMLISFRLSCRLNGAQFWQFCYLLDMEINPPISLLLCCLISVCLCVMRQSKLNLLFTFRISNQNLFILFATTFFLSFLFTFQCAIQKKIFFDGFAWNEMKWNELKNKLLIFRFAQAICRIRSILTQWFFFISYECTWNHGYYTKILLQKQQQK